MLQNYYEMCKLILIITKARPLYFDTSLGLATSSGLSATMLLTHLLKSGEHIVCVDDVYGGMQ